MDVREKLVELIAQKVCETWSGTCDQWLPHDCGKCYANDCHISEIADHLISNGVTVQEWIPVNDERKPKEGEDVLVAVFDGYDTYTDIDCLMRDGKWCFETENYKVTHWMEKPKPPKGE